ncbi:energy-coupling factor transport system ATP-binding protein [Caloranaerobacter azorensis DSM 13643]|uniref:Energy-coupling factor transporter ATP-binding protein EcfA2 n=1 Tax=Caloranaerobacter azorensis DSM 13643 TaxID=1121264 RepID=A0A1M5TZQ2_9FIRM|nr:energy-coupling factor transporter ATPase [Caloranaerobacter azorensis]SHH56164.1 energy-coupling factor transport system ATP-binding protein [Caloranaerobacter azorensis DSM 13643]
MSIVIKNLTHIYNPKSPFETKALDNINLEIDKGEFIGLIGHTGSGKSTFIQHLNGLLKPTSGKIFINGLDITSKDVSLKEIRQKVGLVFQYAEYQLFEETVAKDIAFGPKNLGLSEEEIEKRVKESMEMVGLNYEVLKDRSPFELSGGQKRRVAIAGILAMKPEILILDEPTAGLDPKGRDEILGQIKRLHEKYKITIILVSHSMEDIAKLVDRLIVMYRGKIVMNGTPREIFSKSEELERLGLGIPQITYFMKALKKKWVNIRDDVITVDEAKEEILRAIRGNNYD